ncbi:MAG: PAS domain S-box protein [Deltaproteobacteria bacterium]|nr:PAS domain S-box protein [Deltaproteobacteria bacterium]
MVPLGSGAGATPEVLAGSSPASLGWRLAFIDAVLKVCLVLGGIVCVPSVILAVRAGHLPVAIGDTLAIAAIAVLYRHKRLGYRIRAGATNIVLYLLGLMLLLFIGPISEVYLLGFSLMVTLTFGLRAGMVSAGLNALTLVAAGYLGAMAPTMVLPIWVDSSSTWIIVSLNFVMVNVALVLAIGMVLGNLELGVQRIATARASLQRSEALLEMGSRVARFGAWSVAVPGLELTWSRETREVHEVEDDQVPTVDTWLAFYVPEDRARLRAAIERCVTDGTPFDLELEIITARGRRRAVQAIGEPLRQERGDEVIVAIQGAFQDITERQAAERARKATNETLLEQAALLDKAQDAIMVYALDGCVRYVNAHAAMLYGWNLDSVLGSNVSELGVARDSEVLASARQAVLRDGIWTGELEHSRGDGVALLVEGRWSLLRHADGIPSGILAIHTDITERKRLELQSLRAQRLESIGTLAGGIAHDLNNVLTPLLTSIAFLREGETDVEKVEDLEVLDACARRGADMVRQLLTFARGGVEGRRAPIQLGPIVQDVGKLVRDTFPKNIAAVIETDRTTWPVSANSTQMHQLLVNLCVNARDAMPDGGTLTVVVEHVVLDEVYAGMNIDAKPGPYVLLRVEDTGVGMSKAIQDRIYEPFFTTKGVGKGTGLGLSTCHALVRSHGGFIHLYSEVGRGSRFQIYLPAEVHATVADDVSIDASCLPRGNGELILVVDDEASIRTVTGRTLERYGYTVLLACHGAEAVSLYAQHGGTIALTLTDMSMPVMDGRTTISALRALDPDARIVGSSGMDGHDKVIAALGVGVDDFVPKPYTAESLLRVIRTVIDARGGRQPLQGATSRSSDPCSAARATSAAVRSTRGSPSHPSASRR